MTTIVLILVIVGLIWGTAIAVRGDLLMAGVVYLVAACCFGYHFLAFQFGPVMMTIDRFLLLGLLALAVFQVFSLRLESKPVSQTEVVLIAFLAVLGASLFWGEAWRPRPEEPPPLWRLLAGYLCPAILYFAVRQAATTEERLKRVYVSLAAFGIYLALTGIFEVHQQWSLVFPRYISDSTIGSHFARARGPMVNAVSYGWYLGVGVVSLWALWPWLKRHAQLVVLVLVPLFAAAHWFSYTRSAWIGTGLSLLVLSALALRGKARVAVIGAMCLAALVVSIGMSDQLVGFEREGSASETRESAGMRKMFAYVSWQMFLDRPLWGCGFGRYIDAKNPYLADRDTELHLESIRGYAHHISFLAILVENGIIGLGLFLTVLWMWVREAWQLIRSTTAPWWVRRQGVVFLAALAVYLPHAATHSVQDMPTVNVLLFFLAGVTASLRQWQPATAGVPAAREIGINPAGRWSPAP